MVLSEKSGVASTGESLKLSLLQFLLSKTSINKLDDKTLREQYPGLFTVLVDKTNLELSEVENWKKAADNIYLPFDEGLGIHLQHDGFLDEEVWDFENTPASKYPLLLHFHPLVIYRHQVIKPADIVLAMFLLGHEFSLEQKRGLLRQMCLLNLIMNLKNGSPDIRMVGICHTLKSW